MRVEEDKKFIYQNNDEVKQVLENLNIKYAGQGRILLRHSGTEPLVRIMMEGENYSEIMEDAPLLADVIAKISK